MEVNKDQAAIIIFEDALTMLEVALALQNIIIAVITATPNTPPTAAPMIAPILRPVFFFFSILQELEHPSLLILFPSSHY